MPKVSICIPTYNNIDEVKRLLRSIENQTFTDYEIIITDDSSDNEIEEYVKEYNYINYTHNKPALGHIFNWNAAIEKASGKYIKIMFSDDWFTYDDSLEKLVNMLDEHPECNLAFCNSMQVSGDDSYKRKLDDDYIEKLCTNWRYVFVSNQIGAPSDTLYRNNGIKFDEKSNWASDVELYLMILEKNPNFISTDEPLISIGLHDEQYTHSFVPKDPRIIGDYYFMYKKHKLHTDHWCRQHFLKRYIVPFGKDKKYALECGITAKEYFEEKKKYAIEKGVKKPIRAICNKIEIVKNKR